MLNRCSGDLPIGDAGLDGFRVSFVALTEHVDEAVSVRQVHLGVLQQSKGV